MVVLSLKVLSILMAGYNGLVDRGYQKHFRVAHGKNEFVNVHPLINGIESFWAYAKAKVVQFRALQKHAFFISKNGN